jgi:hypothetical protein
MIGKLIQEGKYIKQYNKTNEFGNWFEGQEYEIWKSKALVFIEKNYKDMEVGKNFISASKCNNIKSYNEMMGILIALEDDYNERKESQRKLFETIDEMNSY